MIITCTLNPTLDRTLTVENFSIGEVQTVSGLVQVAGGKGINVARVIKSLNGEITACGFIGGNIGKILKEYLDREGLAVSFTSVSGETRSNITIIDPVTRSETHLIEIGPYIMPGEVDAFKQNLCRLLPSASVLILSGSLPPGVPDDFYRKLVELARGYNLKVVVDARGEALAEGIKAVPFMIKPNRREAEELIGKSLSDIAAVREAALGLRAGGIEIAAISCGLEGVVIASPEGIWRSIPPKHFQAVNSVGSGDAFVGGFVFSLLQGQGVCQALRLGTACGMANAVVSGAGVCCREDIERFQEMVGIEELG